MSLLNLLIGSNDYFLESPDCPDIVSAAFKVTKLNTIAKELHPCRILVKLGRAPIEKIVKTTD